MMEDIVENDDYAEYLALPVGAVIGSPGKFEGEPRYVPELWDVVGNGDVPDDDGVFEVVILGIDRVRYLELGLVVKVYMWGDEFGAVYSRPVYWMGNKPCQANT